MSTDLTPEENWLVETYRIVIWELMMEDEVRWGTNYRHYANWDNYRRLRWIYWLEQHPNLPIAQTLVAQVMKKRLKR